ncbi:fungal-specific transcription factor domain-containing protein [Trametes meyenii]|nr:fungal-specific transcription factor domain-containing protein [Trametes meyenii]
MATDTVDQPPREDTVTQDSVPAASTSSGGSAAATRNKNGTASKMRSHRGNIPTLPQTKLCPLCPAKFTRTTHLNRHLKTHTNERLHECDRCHAQFTRSDLLTRHRRTCCDSSLANRSRRKSCRSCADSKVKCDLQKPCGRCKTRNRECVYANPAPSVPEESTSGHSQSSPDAVPAESSSSSSPPIQRPSPTTTLPSAHTSSALPPKTSTASSSTLHDPPVETSVTLFSRVGQDTLSNVSVEIPVIQSSAISSETTTHSGEGEKAYPAEVFSSEMYDNLFADLFTSSFEKNPIVPGHHFHQDPTALLTDRLHSTAIGPLTPDAFYDAPMQLAMYGMPALTSTLPLDPLGSAPLLDIPQLVIPRPITPGDPSPAELNEYMLLFLTIFTNHMTVVHVPTFLQGEHRNPKLVTAMQACGAMYANTPTAARFIEQVLANLRDGVVADLSTNTKTYDEIVLLTLASSLVQTIGLFHRDSSQRAKSNVYHGMIVMMLRMSGFVDQTRDWRLQEIDFSDPQAVERAWKGWVTHEMAKRAIWMCYLHDCCHAIYFNLSPTFRTEQFTLGLPCEDGLWTAKTSAEWAILLQTPSPYGSIEVRLCGHYLKALYFYLTQNNPENAPRPFNVSPFAHFIMIHAMMRKLFEMYLRDRLPFSQSDAAGGRPKILPHFVDRNRAFHVQILLHYWLQSWLTSPETPRDVPEPQQRFCFNALPFYWLAQVGLVAYQEGLPPFDAEGTYIQSHDAKFILIKKWERHIRRFLASGEQTATKFWDEVMKIRIESWQLETGFEYENLLGFFVGKNH